jgi:hypothetical protein
MEVDMPRTCLRTAGIALLALLACPRAGNAAFMDIIWEMSGPQMFSVFLLQCEYDLENKTTECRAYDKRVQGEAGARAARKVWLAVDGAVYTSTGKNSGTHRYDGAQNHMVAVEPMLAMHSYTNSRLWDLSVHHGVVGLSYNFLFGDEFTKFDKVGLKFTPVGVTFKNRFNIAYHLRIYPRGFTAEEFGATALLPDAKMHTGREAVHGFSVGYYLDSN